MGSRPSTFKKGGGFLDNVDVTLIDYRFTDEFNGEPFKPGKIKDTKGRPIDKPHTLNCFLIFRVDDAEENTSTTLKAATKYEDYLVSDDGHSVTSAEGGECSLNQNSATAKFFASLVHPVGGGPGFDENQLSEDLNLVDFSPTLGHRFRTTQQPWSEEQLKSIEKLGASRLKKGKDGKEYDRKDLVVESYYGPGEPIAAVATKKTAAKAPVATKAAAGKKTAPVATAAAPAVDIDELAKATVQEIVVEAGEGGIAKSKLSMKILNKLMRHESREDVRKWVFSDENLGSVDGVAYDKSTGLLTVATE